MIRLYALLLFGLFSSQSIAQSIYSKEDVLPTVGNAWHIANMLGDTTPVDLNFGSPMNNSALDLSTLQNKFDLDSQLPLSELTFDNAAWTAEIINLDSLPPMPAVFAEADFVLNLKKTAGGANWYMPYDDTPDGLVVLGEMYWNESTVPAQWAPQVGWYYGPARTMVYDIELGQTKTVSSDYLLDFWTGEDSLVVEEVFTFDWEGDITTIDGSSLKNVCRMIHETNFNVYSKMNGAWEINYQDGQKFVSFHKRGYLLPLAEAYVDWDWTAADSIVSTNEILLDLYFPNFIVPELSSVTPREQLSASINVSPNPAQDFVTIEWNEASTDYATLKWFDVQGRLIQKETWNKPQRSERKTIVTPNHTGIYFLQIVTDQGTITKKIKTQ